MPTLNKVKSKRSCECLSRTSNTGPTEKYQPVKKVVTKKSAPKGSKESKTCSTGVIGSSIRTSVVKPKKTTKSDLSFLDKNLKRQTVFDCCRKCGDVIENNSSCDSKNTESSFKDDALRLRPKEKTDIGKATAVSKPNVTSSRATSRIQVISETFKDLQDTRYKKKSKEELGKSNGHRRITEDDVGLSNRKVKTTKSNDKSRPVQQYYKNENFRRASLSSQEICKYIQRSALLDTINELPEISTAVEDNVASDSEQDSESDDDILIDPDDFSSLTKLRDFRQENYFECHSAKSRLKNKGSASSVLDHKCVYKFYLNDRLFPVPLNTDHHKTIRCSECYLPLDMNEGKESAREINGTIQAKVKLDAGDEAQDMVLMLPVKETLIIQEKRKEKQKANEDLLYFGVIKLDSYGNSMFNSTLPSDSLALKYQKGYKELGTLPEGFKYDRVKEGDVIVI